MEFFHRTWAEIDLNALKHNLYYIKKQADGAKLMAVVKANAYGHSAELVVPFLAKNGVDYFAVSNIDEALQLRGLGITASILILGYTPIDAVELLAENDITQCVYSADYAGNLSRKAVALGKQIKIHIKLDTGMSRLGFSLEKIGEAVESAKLEGFAFEGIFTHFACSDRTPEDEDNFTNEQYDCFVEGVKRFREQGLEPKIVHCCNSAATLLDSDKHCDLVRPGIILYGLTPNHALDFPIIPVMTLKSVVSMVKYIKKGDSVNYGRSFTAQKDMRIATVAAGYADGYPRGLSNKAYVLIKGQRAPVIGRVCMDQLSVDISNIKNVDIGDEVILFGRDLSVNTLADITGTINYEIICNISPRVPRILIKEA